MKEELEEIYKMQKWSNDEIYDELSRPTVPSDKFAYMVMKEALRRILTNLIHK